MNLLRRWPAAMLAAAALSLSVAGPPAAAADNTPFPRRAIIEYGGPFNISGETYADQAFRDSIARFDLTILTTWPGFGGGFHYTVAQTAQDIKDRAANVNLNLNRNHNIKVFLYAKEDNVDVSSTDTAWQAFRDPIAQNHWYLYPSGTSGTPVTSPFGSNYPTINTTVTAAVDYMTDFFDQQLAVPAMDGWFMDDMFATTRVAGDWNRDGNTLNDGVEAASTLLRQGWQHYVMRMRADSPVGMPQLGNVADWATNGVVDSQYQGLLDGGMLEGMIGTSYAPENTSFTKMMDQYRAIMAAFTGDKIGIFVQDGDPNDSKLFRYGLTSALMDNAYYAFTEPSSSYVQYHSIHWFDEYDVNLGQPISAPPTGPYDQSGVWRRDFENGIALVNPKGNGLNAQTNAYDPVTVQLEGPYVKILAGTVTGVHHDPVVNNGATVTSVTFQGRDGILLLRASTPGKLGRTTIGTVPSAGMSANQKRGSKFTLTEAGTLTGFSAYLDGLGGASGSEQVRAVLYQDASGVPGAQVVDSNIVTINSGAAGAWINFTPTSSKQLAAGDYWLVLHTGGTAGVARNMGDGSPTQNWYSNADTFSDGASNPFGTGTAGGGTISIYASYTAGVPKTFGRTTAGTMPSGGMSADFKRASKYTLNETGTLVSLAAYLDGNGGTAGSQSVRLALYQDAGGVPGNKVAETTTVNIAAGTAPGWVALNATTQAALTAGSYWIAIQTGGTAGVARDYTDGSNDQNWFSNADTFSDGSASPFGSGNLGTQNLSVYVNYLH